MGRQTVGRRAVLSVRAFPSDRDRSWALWRCQGVRCLRRRRRHRVSLRRSGLARQRWSLRNACGCSSELAHQPARSKPRSEPDEGHSGSVLPRTQRSSLRAAQAHGVRTAHDGPTACYREHRYRPRLGDRCTAPGRHRCPERAASRRPRAVPDRRDRGADLCGSLRAVK